MKKFLYAAIGATMLTAMPVNAANLAVLGQNGLGSLYAAGGNTVTYVTVAQLGTAGFLNNYDAFVYTRNGFSFGESLSAAAALNVKNFVTGNVVLFAADFTDDIGVANTNRLFNNALGYVTGGAGKGFIGEFNGALSAYASNTSGYTPIGLIQGAAGTLGAGLGGSDGSINATANGAASPITAGVTFPYNPGSVEYGFDQSGFNPNAVIAQFTNGTPAILASNVQVISNNAVPEPATWAMMVLGFGAVGGAMRLRSRRVAFVKA